MPRKKKEKTEPQKCRVEGCPNPAAEDDEDGFCALHGAITDLTTESMQAARKAFRHGDIRQGIFHGLAGLFLGHGEPLVRATVAGMAGRVNGSRPAQAPPPRPEKKDPWVILGLDPAVATEKDVRHVAKVMAQLYHPDKQTHGVSSEKMQEVNWAVQECMKSLGKR